MITAWNGEHTEAGVIETGFSGERATVAVIIPAFNHARFLTDAIMSVRAQTRPPDEIIVVDDGSSDNPAGVLSQFPDLQLIRQENRGPSAARNTGLRICKASHIIFLDADDRLMPNAIESGLACIAARPECALVYGGYRLISEDGQPIGPDRFKPIDGDAHLAFLKLNKIIAVAAALYRRDCLLAVNGFDEAYRRAEDYDIYLRIAQRYPIASHRETVSEYRMHGKNVSNAHFKMLKAVLGVLKCHEARITSDPLTRAALKEGRTIRRIHYASEAITATRARWHERHDIGLLVIEYIQAARWAPLFTFRSLLGGIGRRASKLLPQTVVRWMERIRGRPYSCD